MTDFNNEYELSDQELEFAIAFEGYDFEEIQAKRLEERDRTRALLFAAAAYQGMTDEREVLREFAGQALTEVLTTYKTALSVLSPQEFEELIYELAGDQMNASVALCTSLIRQNLQEMSDANDERMREIVNAAPTQISDKVDDFLAELTKEDNA